MSRFTLGDPDRDDWTPVIQTIFTFVLLASSAAALVGVLLVDQIAGLLGVSRDVTVTLGERPSEAPQQQADPSDQFGGGGSQEPSPCG